MEYPWEASLEAEDGQGDLKLIGPLVSVSLAGDGELN